MKRSFWMHKYINNLWLIVKSQSPSCTLTSIIIIIIIESIFSKSINTKFRYNRKKNVKQLIIIKTFYFFNVSSLVRAGFQ